MAVADNEVALNELQVLIKDEKLDPWANPERLVGDWRDALRNLWDWFVENWPKILEFILTIAPLLLLEPKYED